MHIYISIDHIFTVLRLAQNTLLNTYHYTFRHTICISKYNNCKKYEKFMYLNLVTKVKNKQLRYPYHIDNFDTGLSKLSISIYGPKVIAYKGVNCLNFNL